MHDRIIIYTRTKKTAHEHQQNIWLLDSIMYFHTIFQLLADENAEREKRLAAMDKRLDDLRKERGPLQRKTI